MKQKILLSLVVASFCIGAHAQKNRTTAYAITGVEKGSNRWTEVKLIDLKTGEEIQNVYESSKEIPVLNARTGKAITKKDETTNATAPKPTVKFNGEMKEGDVIVIRRDVNDAVTIIHQGGDGNDNVTNRKIMCFRRPGVDKDKPFSTKSAACAYDKKHDRLYYTPMGINQLRYIDMKSKESKIYYFEDEAFGTVAGLHDVANQITRMVIASDGNGYALTNNGKHLIRFTTNKKAEITDLGSLTDDAANGTNSINSSKSYGGDMVADDNNNLYMITAHRGVFKISIKDMTATYLGAITGLPRGFTTNGAAVEKETTIILSSANSTSGYYKFDLKTLEAEKISENESVFTASDLANGNLIKDKKKKDDVIKEEAKGEKVTPELTVKYKMSAYPNPVAKGDAVYVRFNDFPSGKYQVQLIDFAGKMVRAENVNIGGKMQLHLLEMPKTLSQGTYIIKVVGDANREKVLATEQVIVN